MLTTKVHERTIGMPLRKESRQCTDGGTLSYRKILHGIKNGTKRIHRFVPCIY